MMKEEICQNEEYSESIFNTKEDGIKKETEAIAVKLYLKNEDELRQYLEDLCRQNKNPTLSEVKFDFKWNI